MSEPDRDGQCLASEGAELVSRLGGHWRDERGMCLCPAHADRTPSLSVRVGRTALLFKCFAGCETLEIIRAIRRLGFRLASGGADGGRLVEAVSRREVGRDAARRLWDLSRPLRGSLAEHYLAGRGLTRPPIDLRYHPRTPLGRGRAAAFRPAMLAAVREGRDLVAVHRSFLDPVSAGLARDLPEPRMLLGRPFGGAVQLAPAARRLGLAEGIETASAAIVLFGFPVWAVLGAERLPLIGIPRQVEQLVLLPDNDAAGRLAERKARLAYADLPVALETIWPWWGLNDWGDVLPCAIARNCRQ